MPDRSCATCAAWQLHEAAAHYAEERRACTALPMQQRRVSLSPLGIGPAVTLPDVPVLTRPHNVCRRWKRYDA